MAGMDSGYHVQKIPAVTSSMSNPPSHFSGWAKMSSDFFIQIGVTIENIPYRALVLDFMTARGAFKKIDAVTGKIQRNLHAVVRNPNILGQRECVPGNNPEFFRKFKLSFHKCSFLFGNIQRR